MAGIVDGGGAVDRLHSVVAAFANASEDRVPDGRGRGSPTCASISYMIYGLTLNQVQRLWNGLGRRSPWFLDLASSAPVSVSPGAAEDGD